MVCSSLHAALGGILAKDLRRGEGVCTKAEAPVRYYVSLLLNAR
jgi:hypothetical protein